jgi:hypothetical protein
MEKWRFILIFLGGIGILTLGAMLTAAFGPNMSFGIIMITGGMIIFGSAEEMERKPFR